MLLFIAVILVLDVYTFFGLKWLFKNSKKKKLFYLLFFGAVILSYIGLLNMYFYFRETINNTLISNLLRGFFFSFFAFKLLMVIFLVFNDLLRIVSLIFDVILNFFNTKPKKVELKSRRRFITQVGLVIASIPFTSLLYGITLGKYNFKVIKHALKFKTLPKSFDKFKIVHISDIHAGSFDNLESVQEGIDLIQAQNPDIILLSGDLVNNNAREIEPYISMFKSLKAPHGKFAVLGNHDYGDYKQWNSIHEKEENLKKLFAYFDEMNFKLLNNSNEIITKENESIAIVGVENWGKPPFPQKGDLEKALQNTSEHFKILLSHDPTHWDLQVKNHPSNIALTLSGHTHGMQFGVEIPGIKWSPVKYVYPYWAGLYRFNNKYLNVNRGFGFLGYPGRVGIWPEITLIELNS
ncbi:MAG: metallophosphoesterase [Flavobacteriaceae bacterium]|nr:metallophosphoesterase [Flavobacteriaceae bacterium]